MPVDLGRSVTEGLAVGFDMGRSSREGLERTRALMQDRRHKEEAQWQWEELQGQLAKLETSEQVAQLEYQTRLEEFQQNPDPKSADAMALVNASQPIFQARMERAKRATDMVMQWAGQNAGNPYVEKLAGSFLSSQNEQIETQMKQFTNWTAGLEGLMRSDVGEQDIESREREGAADRASRESISREQIAASDRASGAAGGLDINKVLPDILTSWQQESMTANLQDPEARREYARSHFGLDQDVSVGDLQKLYIQDQFDTLQGLSEGRRFEPKAPAAAAAGGDAQPAAGAEGRSVGRRVGEWLGNPTARPLEEPFRAGARFVRDVGKGMREARGEPAPQTRGRVDFSALDAALKERKLPKRVRVRSEARLRRIVRNAGVPINEFLSMDVEQQADLVEQVLSENPKLITSVPTREEAAGAVKGAVSAVEKRMPSQKTVRDFVTTYGTGQTLEERMAAFDEWVAEGGKAGTYPRVSGKPSRGALVEQGGTRRKDVGFLGEQEVAGGGVATEYSVGVRIDGEETEIPTLVPTLTKAERDLMVNEIIPKRKPIPKAIIAKAVAHAKRRMASGKSPFFESGE